MSDRVRLSVFDVLGPGGLASRALPSFSFRDGQLEMAEAIRDRLDEGGVLAVEAPTGIGKTLAYLVPAILSGRKVIVSTNTKTLQDQIADKDLPLLRRALEEAGVALVRARSDDDAWSPPEEPGLPPAVRYAIMKGRANYLCLDRLERKMRQQDLELDFGDRQGKSELEQIAAWSRETPTGDRAELGALSAKSSLWSELDARAEICSGVRCPRHQECFVVRMRREALAASIVIVNHHLLLADLALRAQAKLAGNGRAFGEVIPAGEVLIVDEAHALEETASEYFGGRISSRQLESLARDVVAHLDERAPRSSSAARTTIELQLTQAVMRAEDVFDALPKSEGRLRIARNEGGEALSEARSRTNEAARALGELADSIELEGMQDPAAEQLARRARTLGEGIRFVLGADDPDYVYWADRQGNATALGASPIDVGSLLNKHLFDQFGAVVLTSATLAAGDNGCRYFLSSVGAPKETDAIVLDSPFDYARQAALYLPRDAPDPDSGDAVRSLAKIGKSVIDLVGGGALFLFTSHRVMRSVHAQLALSLEYPVLLQGERPQRELLRIFVERAPAVLFATASFWEGVDVPGDPLRLVLIDRLPFGSPGDPLVAARGERLEAQGHSAFNSLHLPRAILRLKQGFGRLVRGHQDRGVVAILDRRVQTRGYGKRFLTALPSAARVYDLASLSRWWANDAVVDYEIEPLVD
jgi:ATP-dependent DNA helicase DinG